MAPLPPVNSNPKASPNPATVAEKPASPPQTSPGHGSAETWGTAEKTLGVADQFATAGNVVKNLHEGQRGEALKAAVVGAAATYVVKKIPWVAPLVVAKDSIEASHNPEVDKDATDAGRWVEARTNSPVAGGVAAAAVATGESVFDATFGSTGRAIGEGAAALYLEAKEIILKP